jgi:hypothetical protein
VIVSRPAGSISGTAPAANLVPIRAIRSVVVVQDGDVAKAVNHARMSGCHVISMSLGGVGFSGALRAAIDAAIADGILVLAAAGNQVGFVVSPANYSEVVAVAATNIKDKPWDGSSHGSKVDVAAPGESVHCARAKKGPAGAEYSVGRSSGTSFSVAQTAGVAALWLAHHGRAALVAKYGKQNLQAVFAHLLRTTARKPSGWDTDYGDGIVDAEALLKAPLPVNVPPLAMAAETTPSERLSLYLPGGPAAAEVALAALLPATPGGERDLYAGELAYLLSQYPHVREAAGQVALSGALSGLEGPAAMSLAELRTLASPSLAARMPAPVAAEGVAVA